MEWKILDDEKLCKAFLQYWNTSSARDGLSPAQKLFGHPVQHIQSQLTLDPIYQSGKTV